MRSYCSEWPEFHPEFGLLCPSVRQRRMARLASILFLSLMVIGASRGLAAAHRSNPEEMLAKLVPADDLPVELGLQPPAAAEEGEELARPQNPCKDLGRDDLAAYFLNPGCKIQGRRGVHKRDRTAIVMARIELQSASMAPAPLSTLTLAMRQVATKVATKIAEIENRVSAGAPHTASAKKHKAKEPPIELAHAPARPGGMPNTFISAHTTDTKINRSHGPLADNSGHPSRHGGENSPSRSW